MLFERVLHAFLLLAKTFALCSPPLQSSESQDVHAALGIWTILKCLTCAFSQASCHHAGLSKPSLIKQENSEISDHQNSHTSPETCTPTLPPTLDCNELRNEKCYINLTRAICYHCGAYFSLFLLLFLLIPFYSCSFSDTAYDLASGPTHILIIPSGRGKINNSFQPEVPSRTTAQDTGFIFWQ